MDLYLALALLILTFVTGKYIERRHFLALQKKETLLKKKMLVVNIKNNPQEWNISESKLCMGEVVVGCSYFKRVIAKLKMIFGGRIPTLETLVERARREAVLRMMESAKSAGANLILNVRIETSTIGRGHGNKGISCVEAIAYGTACKKC